nr:unnamed protein product [Digitaria exilis]
MAGSFREGAGTGDAHAPPPTPTPSLSQYLCLDSPAWAADPKQQQQQQHWRHPELRRALAADDQADELRRIRASVQDSTGKAKYAPPPLFASCPLPVPPALLIAAPPPIPAREKVRSLHEAIQKLDKYKNIVTRKRQRTTDAGPDKLASSSGALRIGAQNSSSVLSKRVRSSLADARVEGRASVPTRQSPLVSNDKNSSVEKEKSSTRMSATVSGLSEDKLRGLSTGGEGWEKKMKRKRSVGTMLGRGSDADRDVKSVGQHRPANEVRSRSSDGLPYRHGASAGALAGNKVDGASQQNNIVSRIQSKTDVDYGIGTQPNERRERHAGVDKERTTVKGNKASTSEDMQNGSLSPLPKAKACRAPRTGSLVMNSSSNFQRSTGGSDEWEEAPPYTNKASPLGGITNRKRSTHSNASSPPIAWVGQRSQKMSRTRRANVVSPVSNFDEVLSEGSPLETTTRSTPIESGSVLVTKNTATTKMDSISSPAGLSESEGSAATEGKSKEKAMHSGEVGNDGANAAHAAMGLIFSSNKNRIPLKEELEDGGVRRQGRSGRGTMHVKGCSPIPKEKLDTAETRKPIKGGRPGSEKNESKLGRPPMKKGSDRKASSWHSQALNCEPTDITGEPEDDQEELLAAVTAARSSIVGAYSGPFWKKMEPMLTFISSENLSFLKNQINLVEELEMSMSCISDGEHDIIASSDYRRMQKLPKLEDGEDEDINQMISELRKRLHDQVNQKKCRLHKLDKSIQDTKDLEERSLEQHAMNKLVERAYRKLKGGRVGSSHKAGVSKSANKAAKQLALAFAKRTLARCQKFDETGKSCFSEPSLWSVLSAPLPSSDAKSTEGVERLKHQKLDRTPFDQAGGTKWKKSDRERDHNRDASAKGSGLKSGRHSSGGSGRSGERKNKTKTKQKLAQLSTSGNVLGRVVEPLSSPAVQEPPLEPPSERKTQHPTRNTSSHATQRPTTDAALPVLPGLDDILDVGGLDGQGNDISSWFTDGLDDSLQDIDLSGALEIPDDDLTQLGFI